VVYLSFHKYLHAPFGCVIAGPTALFEGLHHRRRRFGGSLYQMWPAAVLAADSWMPLKPKFISQHQPLRAFD